MNNSTNLRVNTTSQNPANLRVNNTSQTNSKPKGFLSIFKNKTSQLRNKASQFVTKMGNSIKKTFEPPRQRGFNEIYYSQHPELKFISVIRNGTQNQMCKFESVNNSESGTIIKPCYPERKGGKKKKSIRKLKKEKSVKKQTLYTKKKKSIKK